MPDEVKCRWVEELPSILWVYHSTSQTLTNKTLFSLAFGTEVVILIEIGLLTMWIEYFNESSNLGQSRANLDLLKKIWNQARLWNGSVSTKSCLVLQLLCKAYNISSRRSCITSHRSLKIDWVRQAISKFKKTLPSSRSLHQGAYWIEDLNITLIPRTWNA